jgi:hypothetical protein
LISSVVKEEVDIAELILDCFNSLLNSILLGDIAYLSEDFSFTSACCLYFIGGRSQFVLNDIHQDNISSFGCHSNSTIHSKITGTSSDHNSLTMETIFGIGSLFAFSSHSIEWPCSAIVFNGERLIGRIWHGGEISHSFCHRFLVRIDVITTKHHVHLRHLDWLAYGVLGTKLFGVIIFPYIFDSPPIIPLILLPMLT